MQINHTDYNVVVSGLRMQLKLHHQFERGQSEKIESLSNTVQGQLKLIMDIQKASDEMKTRMNAEKQLDCDIIAFARSIMTPKQIAKLNTYIEKRINNEN